MKKLFKSMLAVMMAFSLIACGTDAETSTGGNNEPKNDISKTTYSVGEEITVSTDYGTYTVTFDGIRETDDRNEFWDGEIPNKVVIISYTVKNIDYTDDLYVSDMNFKLYDANGTAMDTYPADTDYIDSISAGRNDSGEAAYALNNDTNHIELEFYDNMFNSKPDFMIEFEW